MRQVGDSRALSIVEKEAMAPRTIGGLARGMAHSGHIYHCWYLLMQIEYEGLCKRTEYHCSILPGVFQVLLFIFLL